MIPSLDSIVNKFAAKTETSRESGEDQSVYEAPYRVQSNTSKNMLSSANQRDSAQPLCVFGGKDSETSVTENSTIYRVPGVLLNIKY